MCFCAGASFAASAGLAVIGIAAQRLVTTPHQRMFATIPLLFAMQQAAEGIVWLTVNNPEYKMLTLIGVYTFLTYAFIVWPFWIPFSVSLMERTRKRKSLLQGISLLGAGISLFLGWLLVKHGAQASIINHSVYYDVARPKGYVEPLTFLYAVTTIAPFFIVIMRGARLFGFLILASFIAAYSIWRTNFVSVWCFFAALISVGVLAVLYWRHQDNKHYNAPLNS